MDSVFIGEFTTVEQELKHEKGKADSLKQSVIRVTQGFLEGELHRWSSLALYLVV